MMPAPSPTWKIARRTPTVPHLASGIAHETVASRIADALAFAIVMLAVVLDGCPTLLWEDQAQWQSPELTSAKSRPAADSSLAPPITRGVVMTVRISESDCWIRHSSTIPLHALAARLSTAGGSTDRRNA